MPERREHGAERLSGQAERGDLRPQVNPHTPLHQSPEALRQVEPILLERFFHLSRPIASAAEGARPQIRLSDAGQFFYLVEALRRAGSDSVDQTLLVILDEFLQLTERSYDELYLWSIVELSRRDPAHVETFWPAAIALDQRFRPDPWHRPAGVALVDQPYRLCELIFYFYGIYTLHLRLKTPDPPPKGVILRAKVPSLGMCIQRIVGQLSDEQKRLVGETLRQAENADWRALFGDALGMLTAERRGVKRFV